MNASGDRVTVALPKDLLATLQRMAEAHGATLFMAMVAGFSALLARYTGREDITIGVPVAGRDDLEVEGLIGAFINTLPLRIAVAPRQRFDDLLAAVREVTLQAQEHQQVPFERMVAAVAAPARDPGRSPLVQVMFNLLNTPVTAGLIPGLDVQPLSIKRQASALDLTLLVDGASETLTAEFRTDVLTPAGAEQIVTHFVRLLEASVAAPLVRRSRCCR